MFHQSLLAFLLFYFYSIVCLLQLRNDPYFRVQQSSRTTFFMKQEYRLFRSSRTSTSNCVHQNNRIVTFVFSRTTWFLYLYTYLHFCSLVTQGNLISFYWLHILFGRPSLRSLSTKEDFLYLCPQGGIGRSYLCSLGTQVYPPSVPWAHTDTDRFILLLFPEHTLTGLSSLCSLSTHWQVYPPSVRWGPREVLHLFTDDAVRSYLYSMRSQCDL